MVGETQMISSSTAANTRSNGRNPRPGFGALIHDLISLMELQTRLLLKDLGDLQAGALVSLAMLAAGIVLAFATAPVLLLTVGWCLVEFASFPLWAAMATSVVGGGIAPAMLLMYFGWKLFREKSSVLKRSASELEENTRWLKHRIKSSF